MTRCIKTGFKRISKQYSINFVPQLQMPNKRMTHQFVVYKKAKAHELILFK